MDELTLKQLRGSNFYSPEIIDLVFDSNKMVEIITDWVNIAEKGFDTLWDPIMFDFLCKYCREGMYLAKRQIKEKGIKIRMITETTKENLGFIDSLNCPNMRHLDGIRGNFGIFDQRAYMVYIFHKENEKPDQALWNNSKVLVDQQQILFNKLWKISIPFSTRKTELENAENPPRKKIFTDYKDIQQELVSIVEQCRKELWIFSSTKLFNHVINKNNFLKYSNTLLKKDIRVKILFDGIDLNILKQIREINNTTSSNQIQIGYTNKLGNFNELVVINDQKSVLKIKYDNTLNLGASVSNEEHQIVLQGILFEKYWNEIESLSSLNNMTKGD